MNKTPKIHPNAPPKLIKKLRSSGSFHKLADEIGVNVADVHKLITAGIEPTDRTEHGRDIRARLFLRRHKPKPGKASTRAPMTEHERWWRKIGKAGRDRIKERLHHYAKRNQEKPL